MNRRTLARMLAALMVCALVLAPAPAETPWTQTLAAQALNAGFLSSLPPKLSAAFGLAKPEQGTAVRQLIAGDAHRVRTFNVCVANHADLVIFNVDAHTNASVAYLLTPDGQLRRALSYRNVDEARPLTAAEAQAGFLSEKRFWSARARQGAAVPAH